MGKEITKSKVDDRLSAIEDRLERLETMITELSQSIKSMPATSELKGNEGIKQWVTDYVSLRLQQLVPETCEHSEDEFEMYGPTLPGTKIRCTDEVLHRLGRIPIPFVREMVTRKVAETAQQDNVALVDVKFFEKAATF